MFLFYVEDIYAKGRGWEASSDMKSKEKKMRWSRQGLSVSPSFLFVVLSLPFPPFDRVVHPLHF